MKSSDAQQWFDSLDEIDSDPQLNVWHIALLIAIARLACKQNEQRIVRVSRNRLMRLSHIQCITSYHKYFKELQLFGYIKYAPSYHPGYRSTVEVLWLQKE